MSKKSHKILIELVAKEKTEMGAIPILESVKLIDSIGKVAKKFKFDCYVKGLPKDKIDYKPTNKEYKINTLRDIVEKLSLDQFEFFIEDLRSWVTVRKNLEQVNELFGSDIVKPKNDSMIWLDTGLNESKISFETTNKL